MGKATNSSIRNKTYKKIYDKAFENKAIKDYNKYAEVFWDIFAINFIGILLSVGVAVSIMLIFYSINFVFTMFYWLHYYETTQGVLYMGLIGTYLYFWFTWWFFNIVFRMCDDNFERSKEIYENLKGE